MVGARDRYWTQLLRLLCTYYGWQQQQWLQQYDSSGGKLAPAPAQTLEASQHRQDRQTVLRGEEPRAPTAEQPSSCRTCNVDLWCRGEGD